MKCNFCGMEIDNGCEFCPHCGRKLSENVVNNQCENCSSCRPISPCNRWIAFILCFLLGGLGIHRFYVGKIGTGILYIFTFGLFGIGALVDLIMLACGTFTDKSGLMLKE